MAKKVITIYKARKMEGKKDETQIERIDRQIDEEHEQFKKMEKRFHSCPTHADYLAYVRGKLQHYEKRDRELLLNLTGQLNGHMDLLNERLQLLFLDSEFVPFGYRIVNDEEQDVELNGCLGEISGIFEIRTAVEEVASLEVILVQAGFDAITYDYCVCGLDESTEFNDAFVA